HPVEPPVRTLLRLTVLILFAAPLAAQAVDTSAFGSLTWRNIWPQRGGRSVAVAGSSSRPNEYYMGTTGGGVFTTTVGGASWAPVSDKYFGGTIGAIGVSESNPDVVYVGGGEFPIRGNVSHGDGVYKRDRKSTRLNSSHDQISYAVFCLKKKKNVIFLDDYI